MVAVLEEAVRFDRGTVNKVNRSEEGFLTVAGIATRTGVFPYREPSGKVRYELRHPDDVLDPESLRTLGGKPATLEHPPNLVDPKTAGNYSVGSINNKVTVLDDGLIEVIFNVHRQDAIDAIESGEKRQISCGYRCDVAEEEGVFDGQPYTHRQKNIRYNHGAFVKQGRAGAIASLHMDSADGIELNVAVQDCECEWDGRNVNTGGTHDDSKSNTPRMAKIIIDSVEYEISEALAPVVAGKLSRIDSLEKEVTTLTQSRTDTNDTVAQLNQQVTQLTQERDRAQGRVFGLEQDVENLQFDLEELQSQHTDRADSTDDARMDEAEIEQRIEAEVKVRCDALAEGTTLLSTLKAQGINTDEIHLDASMSPFDMQQAIVVGVNPGVEIADDEVKGYYRALSNNKASRNDSVSVHHADVLEAAVNAASSTKKKGKTRAEADKGRMDNCRKPLAMSK